MSILENSIYKKFKQTGVKVDEKKINANKQVDKRSFGKKQLNLIIKVSDFFKHKQ